LPQSLNRAIVGAALSFSATNNRITTADYTYDAVGNLTNDSTQALSYDAENKITKVDNVSSYVYDGEGQRVRKLVGENLCFVYDMSGNQIAEFDGATGSLMKEYIYGASGLVATIEPTAVNANGTRYTTSDHLGSPRVTTEFIGWRQKPPRLHALWRRNRSWNRWAHDYDGFPWFKILMRKGIEKESGNWDRLLRTSQ
jgi:hypothetical protein